MGRDLGAPKGLRTVTRSGGKTTRNSSGNVFAVIHGSFKQVRWSRFVTGKSGRRSAMEAGVLYRRLFVTRVPCRDVLVLSTSCTIAQQIVFLCSLRIKGVRLEPLSTSWTLARQECFVFFSFSFEGCGRVGAGVVGGRSYRVYPAATFYFFVGNSVPSHGKLFFVFYAGGR